MPVSQFTPQHMDPEAPPIPPHFQDDKETNAGDLHDRSGNPAGSPAQGSQATPIVGDFDGSANALWSLYGKEAKSHDEATVQILMDSMGSVLTFAGLFSAVLAAFLVDRYQNLRQSPTQQSAYYQQQSAVLLNQISHQLTSLGAQIPANLSLPGPTFNASASDVRVNIFWFSSLVFSLAAALLATLFQRWTQDYMYIFQRYNHPLDIARIRQFLHEGAQRWLMLPLSEVVPGLIHISLFLFLIGLADFLLSSYPLVGKVTIASIAFCAALYFLSTVAPFFDPKSPYHTSFSHAVWYLTRKLQKHWPKGLLGLSPRHLDAKMAEGQMQLAMENSDARKDRDKRAIQWLVTKLTEDGEMESLASGIPGSFNPEWGVEVWKRPLRPKKGESTSSTDKVPSQLPQQDPRSASPSHNGAISGSPPPSSLGDVVDDLCQRIKHLFVTCNHRDSFLNEDERRKRLRACVETAASFVFCMDFDIRLFGDMGMIGKLLSELGSAEKTREVSASSLNWSFISRWTCFSIVVIRKLLNSPPIKENASGPILLLGNSYGAGKFDPAETALKNATKLDKQFVEAWGCMEELRRKFINLNEGGRRGGKVEDILHDYNPKLEQINELAACLKTVDSSVSHFQQQIDHVTHNLIRQLPGVAFDELAEPTPLGHVFDFLASASPVHPQLLHLSPRLLGLGTLSHKRSSRGYIETAGVLTTEKIIPEPQHHLMERLLWRLEDLSKGAFGFTLELYFLSLRQILSPLTSEPKEIHRLFHTSAFKAITSDWERFKESRGTLHIILNLVCDIALRNRGIFSPADPSHLYPDYIKNELLGLFDNMMKGQASLYIDAAMKELKYGEGRKGDEDFRVKALTIFLAHKPPRS